MRKVSSQKTIRRLAFCMLKASKKRNITVVFAVILTSMLFTVLFSVGMSMIKTVQQSTMKQVGTSSMAGLKYSREKDYERLKKDPALKNISYRIIVGELADERLKNLTNEVYYATDENAKCTFSYPSIGKMPEKPDEIALSSLTLERLGLNKNLGQSIFLQILIGDHILSGDFVLSGIYEGDAAAMSQMVYVSKEYQEITAPAPERSYYDSDRMDLTGYWSIDFDFYHSFDIERQTKELLERNGYDTSKVLYGINWAYMTSRMDWQEIVLYLVIFCMILLAGYLIIYNIFSIRVTGDIHEYGLLKTIGTSGRQLRKIVGIQANVLSLFGIALGLLLGTILSKSVFPIILNVTTIGTQDVVFSVHPFIYLFAAVFSFLTVKTGCRKAQKTAGRVSPIAAVTYSEYDSTSKKRKKQKKTKKITLLSLSLMNLNREKRKTFIVILSLSLSILLVNGMYSVIKGMDIDQFISQSIIGDFVVSDAAYNNMSTPMDETSVVPSEKIKKLEKMDGVKQCSNIYCDRYASLDMQESMEKKIQRYAKNCPDYLKNDLDYYLSEKTLDCHYYGIDHFPMEYIEIKDGEVKEELWKTGEYAIAYSNQLIDNTQDTDAGLFQIGDKVTVTLQNNRKKTYQVMAIGSMPYAMSTKNYFIVGCEIIVPEREYLEQEGDTGAMLSILNAKEDRISSLDHDLQSFLAQFDSLTYVSKKTYLDELNHYIMSIELVGGGLALILAIIGIMNFANTVITGIWRRTRELSVMQAVGLTEPQMTKMLVLEGMMQGIATIVFSVILWALTGSFVIKSLAGEIWFFKYHFTFVPILLCLPFVLLVSIVIPFLTCRNFRQKTIVDRMRMEG